MGSKNKARSSKGELAFSVKAQDCEWDYFRAGGKGGQHQNKTSSACRVKHVPSGAVGESREQRSQLQNRRAAWKRMVESTKFYVWINQQLAAGPTPEQKVERDMLPSNICVEVRRDGKWVDEKTI